MLPYRPEDERLTPEDCHILELLGAADDPAVSLARARVPPGVTTQWHRLRGVVERYVILSGRGVVEIGASDPRVVGPMDVVLIPAGARQRIRNSGSGDLLFLCVCTPPFRQDCYEEVDRER